MKLIFCLDDTDGMTFGGRRQSRDARVYEDIARDLKGGTLTIAPFSEKLLASAPLTTVTLPDPLEAEEGATVFLEDRVPNDAAWARVRELVIYRWGRRYPKDLTFIMPSGFRKIAVMTFVGNSHDTITKEVYKK